ncbi:MAG: hypothetical protein AB7K24_01705 [Gemmataceae bacterium]
MHVVCFNMVEHYSPVAVKPGCVRFNCAGCDRDIHVCEDCESINLCEACATSQVLFEDQRAELQRHPVTEDFALPGR